MSRHKTREQILRDNVDKLVASVPHLVVEFDNARVVKDLTNSREFPIRKPRILNRDAWKYVHELRPFKGSHLWGEWAMAGETSEWQFPPTPPENDTGVCLYRVYSYRRSWPLMVYDLSHDKWIANGSRVSRTTSRQMANCRPEQMQPVWVCSDDAIGFANHGFLLTLSRRIASA